MRNWELDRRSHRFVRYADDCNVYVRSERAGLRVMASLKDFIEKRLKLKVNDNKSKVARPQERTFLSFKLHKLKRGPVRILLAEGGKVPPITCETHIYYVRFARNWRRL